MLPLLLSYHDGSASNSPASCWQRDGHSKEKQRGELGVARERKKKGKRLRASLDVVLVQKQMLTRSASSMSCNLIVHVSC